MFVTLDGYAAGPNGELDFVTETGAAADPTSGPFVEDQLAFIESPDTNRCCQTPSSDPAENPHQ